MSDSLDIQALLTAWAAWSAESRSDYGHNILASFMPARGASYTHGIDEADLLAIDAAIARQRAQDDSFMPYIVLRYQKRLDLRNIAKALEISYRRARDNVAWAETLVAQSFLGDVSDDSAPETISHPKKSETCS